MNITYRKNNRGAFPELGHCINISATAEDLSLLDLFKILSDLVTNEEKIWPKNAGYNGSELLKNAVWLVLHGKDPALVYAEFMKPINPKDMGNSFFDPKEWNKVFCDSCSQQAFCPNCNKFIWIKKGDVL